ncbi:MAG: hypothetical protein ABIL22_00995 [candidate division WOR-3 bacterium]
MIFKYVVVLVVLIVLIAFIAQFVLFGPMRNKNHYITIKEVIPDAKIISESEGIIEYEGIKFILGQTDFERKKNLIRDLRLDELNGVAEVDMRFRKQIIVRKNEFKKN